MPRNSLTIARHCALLLAAPVATPALADSPSDTGDAAAITVIGAPQPMTEIAGSVSLIDAADLRRWQTVELASTLARLPGVSVTSNGAVGGFTGVRIRGADAAQTLVVIDGVRVGDPTSPGGGFDFASLYASDVARVELLRGPGSVAWGSDAIGGVVLVSTPAAQSGTHGAATISGGSFGTAQANADMEVTSGPVGLSLGGGYFTTDGVSAAATGQEADGYRRWSGRARVAVDLAPDARWTSSLYYVHGRVALDGYPPPTYQFGDTSDYSTSQEIYAGTRLDLGSVDSLRQSLSATLADINRDNYSAPGAARADFIARGRATRLAYQADWRATGGALRLIGGGDYEWTSAYTDDGFSVDRPSTGNGGVYGEAVATLGDGLQLVGGVRHDMHQRFGGATVGSASLHWQSAKGWQAHLAYAGGYRAPTLFELSGSVGGYGNPDLAPERSDGFEASAGYGTSAGAISLTLFRRDSRDLIDFVSCIGPAAPAICATGNRPYGTYANVARARTEGIEIVGQWRIDAWTIGGNLTHLVARDRSTAGLNAGNDLARRPRDSANASIDWAQPLSSGGDAGLGVDIRYVGPSFDDAGNSQRLGGFTLVTLRGTMTITRGIDLFARVDNLGDVRYQTVAGYGTLGRGFSIGVRARR